MSLSTRDVDLRELMDDPACDPELLRATLERFSTVNGLISAWGTVYRRRIAPHIRGLGRPARVLDLGCGGGDVVLNLARCAARDGLAVEWVGVDPDERAITVAQARARGLAKGRARAVDAASAVSFVCTDSAGLLADGERFDVVLSNHVLHHLSAAELASFADESRRLSRGIVLLGDIERSRLAYGLYAVAVTPLAPGTFLRTDGLRSIRRSYRAAELQDALGTPWRVLRPAPFRVLAVADGTADAASGDSHD